MVQEKVTPIIKEVEVVLQVEAVIVIMEGGSSGADSTDPKP
jgi:hypothetical protein